MWLEMKRNCSFIWQFVRVGAEQINRGCKIRQCSQTVNLVAVNNPNASGAARNSSIDSCGLSRFYFIYSKRNGNTRGIHKKAPSTESVSGDRRRKINTMKINVSELFSSSLGCLRSAHQLVDSVDIVPV